MALYSSLMQSSHVTKSSNRIFRCLYMPCRKTFPTEKDLKRHWVVHTGLREFKCSDCNAHFGRKDHMLRHKRKTHTKCIRQRFGLSKYSEPPENAVKDTAARIIPYGKTKMPSGHKSFDVNQPTIKSNPVSNQISHPLSGTILPIYEILSKFILHFLLNCHHTKHLKNYML